MKLNVSCIQRFSTGDGPGIRTTVFLKGCNLRCPWCHNPENVLPEPQTLIYKSSNKSVTYGKMMNIDDIVNDVVEDIDFYKQSGGGVTLSGGEPMLQAEAAGELSRKLKQKGVDTLIDTAGCVPFKNFYHVLDFVDTYYFDYKTADAEEYKTINGDKTVVLENLKKLVHIGKNIHARIPLIPDFNTSEKDCENICRDLLYAGVKYVDLLPFHRLGLSKYDALSLDYAYKNTQPQSREEIEKIKKIYEKYFITAVE